MTPTVASLVAIGLSYLIGSLPFGYLTARLVAGIDVRQAGSGNIGATNVARVLGTKWGVVVFILDWLKGLFPALMLPWLLLPEGTATANHVAVACGLATILGHIFPCWLGFRGGKGVATAFGVVLVLAPLATGAAAAVFAVAFGISRIVSLASMLAAVTFAAVKLGLLWPHPFSRETWSIAAFSLLVPLLIVFRHRTNLVRLLKGQESRFGSRPATNDNTESKPQE